MTQDDSLIVSVSGVRGIVGRGLTPEVATAFAGALGTYVNGGRVVLSRDGRPSGTMLRHAVLAGLLRLAARYTTLEWRRPRPAAWQCAGFRQRAVSRSPRVIIQPNGMA